MKKWISCSLLVASLFQGQALASSNNSSIDAALVRLANSPGQPTPDAVAQALHITFGTPSLEGGFLSEPGGTITYPVKANRRGVHSVRLSFVVDDSGVRVAFEVLDIDLDPTVCVDPTKLPASTKFEATHRAPQKLGDFVMGPRDSYSKFVAGGKVFTLFTNGRDRCANSVSFVMRYAPDPRRPEALAHQVPEPPLIDETPIVKAQHSSYPLHPPFTAVDFWKKIYGLIQSRHGYITSDALEKALQIDRHVDQSTGEQSDSYNLLALRDWYIGLSYKGYSKNADAPSSSVTFDLNPYTFLDERHKPDCLSGRHVEEDLLNSGWKETSSLFSNTNTPIGEGRKAFIMPNTNSRIWLDIEAYTANRCLTGMTIAGSGAVTLTSTH